MEDLTIRFHYAAGNIFNHLDDKSINQCRLVCRSWRDCIDGLRFYWMRIIKKFTEFYNPEKISLKYNIALKNAPLYITRELAHAYHEFYKVNPKNKGTTPIHVSAWNGNSESVKYILRHMDSKRMPLNPADSSEWTPLHWGAFSKYSIVSLKKLFALMRKHQKMKIFYFFQMDITNVSN